MKKICVQIRFLFFVSVMSCSPLLLNAQSGAEESIFDYLVAQGVSEVTITTDLVALMAGEEQEKEEVQEAVLTYFNAEQEQESWELELTIRGKFRRRTCEFPPLKLDFSKSDLRERGLADFDKYKLVTHCQENRQAARDALLREYTIYQLYNALTPASYETHLLRINYQDREGKVNSFRQYAFLLESTKELATRMAAEECEDCLSFPTAQIEESSANLHAVFQYMIGNADFNLTMLRNVKLFTRKEKPALPIAYDFDFAALVNAPYAIPSSELGQKSIQDRIFLGAQVSDAQMEATLAHFENKREVLFQIIKDQRLLSSNARFEMRTYLKSFYDHLTDLRATKGARTYSQLREKAPKVVPAGAKPEDFGVRK